MAACKIGLRLSTTPAAFILLQSIIITSIKIREEEKTIRRGSFTYTGRCNGTAYYGLSHALNQLHLESVNHNFPRFNRLATAY